MTSTNQKRASFRFSPVAAGCAVLLVAASAAQAQQAVDNVVVTGIRAAIESAISTKKNADGIVEAISAEDIGKLPDTTVAESISRLPGVTAQRSAVTGRAQGVSVRGMSPDFNGGLLNGREQASTASNRGVEFDQFPAELLSSVVVYKTADASLAGQGLSSTIDLQTVRPLNFAKRNVVVSARGESMGKAESQPGFGTGNGDRYSVSYIDQFADRTVGVALGFVKSKSNGGGRPNFNTWGGWVADVDYQGQKVKAPGGFTTDIETINSDRTGAMAVLQYKPNKDFESTVDFFHSKGNFSVQKRGLEGPVGGLSAGGYDSGGVLTNATIVNGIAQSGTFTNFRGVIRNHNEDYTDTLNSLGWATKFKAADWRIKTDLSYSKVVKDSVRFETTAGLPGSVNNPLDTISFSGFNGSNLANVAYKTGLNYADLNIIKLTNPQGWGGGTQDGYYAAPSNTDSIKSARLSGGRDVNLGPIVSADIGLIYSDRSKTRTTQEGALLLNAAGPFAASAIPGATTGVGGLTGIPTLNWNPAGSLGSVYKLSPWTEHDIVSKNWGVNEKVTTAYVKGDIDSKVMDHAVRGNVGLQMIHTNQSTSGYRVDQSSCNGDTHSCGYASVTGGTSYNDFLPSLNLATDLGNDNVLRFGLGRVLARPNMEDMKATRDFSLDTTTGVPMLKGSGGNPNLQPFRADTIDVSWEKYFGKKGYFSIAGYYKDLKTYILKRSQVFDFANYITPGTVLPAGGSTMGLLTQASNGSGGSINGIEMALNVPFSMASSALDGFGVVVNTSVNNSSVSLPASGFSTSGVNTTNIPLPGLSKQVTNLRLYYEKNGLQMSVAARKRSDFLGSIADYQDNTQLVYIKGETQVDAQASYEFTQGQAKGLTLLVQGINLTNAEFAQYDAKTGNTTDRKKFGPAVMFGASYKF